MNDDAVWAFFIGLIFLGLIFGSDILKYVESTRKHELAIACIHNPSAPACKTIEK